MATTDPRRTGVPNLGWDGLARRLVLPDSGAAPLEPYRLSYNPAAASPPIDATGITITPGPTVATNFAAEQTTLDAALPKLYNFAQGNDVVTNADAYLLTPGGFFRNPNNLGAQPTGEARNNAGSPSWWGNGLTEFMTDSQDLCIKMLGPTAATLSLYVDGVLASSDTVSTVAPQAGGNRPMWFRIQFATRRVRRLSFVASSQMNQIRLISSSDSIWKPQEQERLHVVGDSFAAALVGPAEAGVAHSASGLYVLRLAARVGRILGFPGISTGSSRGSTGFCQGTSEYNYLNRMTLENGSSAVRVLHLFGTGNDSIFTSAERQANVAACIEVGRAKFPNAVIVVSSPVEGFSGTAIVNPIAADIAAACARFPSSVVKYLPIHSAGRSDEGYIYGTGRVGATAGNGNADIYLGAGTADRHWNNAGIQYAAQRFAADIVRLVNQ